MSATEEIPAELLRLADDLKRHAAAAADATGVYVEALPIVRLATVLIVRAACAGLMGDPKVIVQRTTGSKVAPAECDPMDRFVGTLIYVGRSAECDGVATEERLRSRRDLAPAAIARLSSIPENDHLLLLWRLLIRPHVRAARPHDFRPDGAEYDFPRESAESRAIRDQSRDTGVIDLQRYEGSTVANAMLGPVGHYTRGHALTHARAQTRVWAETMRAAANLIGEITERPKAPEPPFEAAENFEWVQWPSGRRFDFTPGMRPAIAKLCSDYRRGHPTTKDGILDAVERSRTVSVRHLFRRKGSKPDPAWGTMIVPVEGSKGLYTLRDPGPATAPVRKRRRSPPKSP